MLIHPSSLSRTIDAAAAALFDGRRLPASERKQVARWIAARQGLPGAYGDTFAAFASERSDGIVVFTGERMTNASARHIVGEEACRLLRLLGVADAGVRAALERADDGLLRCLDRAARDPRNDDPGRYCCGKCTVAVWRNLLSGGLDRREERLHSGVKHLRSLRKDDGHWNVFPFWYTVLALAEMESAEATKELCHAAPVLDRAVRRSASGTTAERRRELARRVLERIGRR